MNRTTSRILALFLSLLMLLSLGIFAFAEGDADAAANAEGNNLPNPYIFKDDDRLLSFDSSTGTLTIGGKGDLIKDETAFWAYIEAIAGTCKTVFLKKDALMRNRDAKGSEYYLFEKALSALTALEAFTVEEGNSDYAARNGVLYDSTVTSLIHYPAGKQDDSYKMESRCMSIRPFAFCNTQYLRILEFNYTHILFRMPSLLANAVSDGSRRHFMSIAEYGLGNVDLKTDVEKESSIRTLVWYGEEEELREIAAKHQGNNIGRDASVSTQPTSIINDFSVFSNRMLFVLGLSKESRNNTKNDLLTQLREAIDDIIHTVTWDTLTTLIG